MGYTAIRPRRGTKEEWSSSNPLLIEGEIGFEVPDEGVGSGQIKIKQGDGITNWNDLPYALSFEGSDTSFHNPSFTGYMSMNRKANTDIGNYSVTLGFRNIASGNYSYAEGRNTNAIGEHSHAGGCHTTAGYEYQTAIGICNSNYSDSLFEIGNGTYDVETSTGKYSNAFRVTKYGDTYTTLGYYGGNIVFNSDELSMNRKDRTNVGQYSVALGYRSTASGNGSVSIGFHNKSTGIGSYSLGYYNRSRYDYQTSIGYYNDNCIDSLFEIGNGTDGKLSNFRLIESNDPTHPVNMDSIVRYIDGFICVGRRGKSYFCNEEDIPTIGKMIWYEISNIPYDEEYNNKYYLAAHASWVFCVSKFPNGDNQVYEIFGSDPSSWTQLGTISGLNNVLGIVYCDSKMFCYGVGSNSLCIRHYNEWEFPECSKIILSVDGNNDTLFIIGGSNEAYSDNIYYTIDGEYDYDNWKIHNPYDYNAENYTVIKYVGYGKYILAGYNGISYYCDFDDVTKTPSNWIKIQDIDSKYNIFQIDVSEKYIICKANYKYYYIHLYDIINDFANGGNGNLNWKELSLPPASGIVNLSFCTYINEYYNIIDETIPTFLGIDFNNSSNLYMTSNRSNAFRVTKNGDIYYSGNLYGENNNAINVSNGTFTDFITTSSLTANTGTFSSGITANTGNFSSGITANTGTFSSKIIASTGTFSSNLTTVKVINRGMELVIGPYSNKHALIRSDNNNTYFLVCDANSDSFNSLRPISYNNTTGNVTIPSLNTAEFTATNIGSISSVYQSNTNLVSPVYETAFTINAGNTNYSGLNYGRNIYGLHINAPYGVSLTSGGLYIRECVNSQVTASPNCYIDTYGRIFKTSGSSKRFKTDIKVIENKDLDPNALYDLDVVQYKLKDKYNSKNDSRYNNDIIGFVAEDVYDKYKIAADYHIDENNKVVVDDWNLRIMVPAMLKLIQDLKKEIDELKK